MFSVKTDVRPTATGRNWYLRRPRVVGVTEAVGEEEDDMEEAEPRASREVGAAPSGADLSRFISSLLLREPGGTNRARNERCTHTHTHTHAPPIMSSLVHYRSTFYI